MTVRSTRIRRSALPNRSRSAIPKAAILASRKPAGIDQRPQSEDISEERGIRRFSPPRFNGRIIPVRSPAEIWWEIYPLLAQQIIDDYQIKKGRCVEIGSGDGKLGLELVKRAGLHVYIVDINKDVLEKALSRACDAGLADRTSSIQADVERLPFVNDFADLIVSRGSIFFWNDKPRGLSEIYRVLKAGGVAFVGGGLSRYISEQEREEFIRARTAELKDEQSRKEWERVRSPEYFRQNLRQAGISHFKLIADPPGIWTEIVKEE